MSTSFTSPINFQGRSFGKDLTEQSTLNLNNEKKGRNESLITPTNDSTLLKIYNSPLLDINNNKEKLSSAKKTNLNNTNNIKTPTKMKSPIKKTNKDVEYSIIFPPGSMGLELEPIIISSSNQIGCRVKDFYFDLNHTGINCDYLLDKVSIGDIITTVQNQVILSSRFTDILDCLRSLKDQNRSIIFKNVSATWEKNKFLSPNNNNNNNNKSNNVISNKKESIDNKSQKIKDNIKSLKEIENNIKDNHTYLPLKNDDILISSINSDITLSTIDLSPRSIKSSKSQMLSPKAVKDNLKSTSISSNKASKEVDIVGNNNDSILNNLFEVFHNVGSKLGERAERALVETSGNIPKYTDRDINNVITNKHTLLNELSRMSISLGVLEDKNQFLTDAMNEKQSDFKDSSNLSYQLEISKLQQFIKDQNLTIDNLNDEINNNKDMLFKTQLNLENEKSYRDNDQKEWQKELNVMEFEQGVVRNEIEFAFNDAVKQLEITVQDRDDRISEIESSNETKIDELESLIKDKVRIMQQFEISNKDKDDKIKHFEKTMSDSKEMVDRFELAMKDKDSKVEQFELSIQDKDGMIEQFESLIEEKDIKIDQFKLAMQGQDGMIEQFEALIQDKDEKLEEYESLIKERDIRIDEIELLNEIIISNNLKISEEHAIEIDNFTKEKLEYDVKFHELIKEKEELEAIKLNLTDKISFNNANSIEIVNEEIINLKLELSKKEIQYNEIILERDDAIEKGPANSLDNDINLTIIKNYECDINKLTNQINELNNTTITTLENEKILLKEEIEVLIIQNSKNNEKLIDSDKKINIFEKAIENYKNLNEKLAFEFNIVRKTAEEYEVLREEFLDLKEKFDDNTKESIDNEIKYNQIKEEFNEHQENESKLINEMNSYHDLYNSNNIKFETLQQQYDDLNNLFEEKYNNHKESDSLKDENIKILENNVIKLEENLKLSITKHESDLFDKTNHFKLNLDQIDSILNLFSNSRINENKMVKGNIKLSSIYSNIMANKNELENLKKQKLDLANNNKELQSNLNTAMNEKENLKILLKDSYSLILPTIKQLKKEIFNIKSEINDYLEVNSSKISKDINNIILPIQHQHSNASIQYYKLLDYTSILEKNIEEKQEIFTTTKKNLSEKLKDLTFRFDKLHQLNLSKDNDLEENEKQLQLLNNQLNKFETIAYNQSEQIQFFDTEVHKNVELQKIELENVQINHDNLIANLKEKYDIEYENKIKEALKDISYEHDEILEFHRKDRAEMISNYNIKLDSISDQLQLNFNNTLNELKIQHSNEIQKSNQLLSESYLKIEHLNLLIEDNKQQKTILSNSLGGLEIELLNVKKANSNSSEIIVENLINLKNYEVKYENLVQLFDINEKNLNNLRELYDESVVNINNLNKNNSDLNIELSILKNNNEDLSLKLLDINDKHKIIIIENENLKNDMIKWKMNLSESLSIQEQYKQQTNSDLNSIQNMMFNLSKTEDNAKELTLQVKELKEKNQLLINEKSNSKDEYMQIILNNEEQISDDSKEICRLQEELDNIKIILNESITVNNEIDTINKNLNQCIIDKDNELVNCNYKLTDSLASNEKLVSDLSEAYIQNKEISSNNDLVSCELMEIKASNIMVDVEMKNKLSSMSLLLKEHTDKYNKVSQELELSSSNYTKVEQELTISKSKYNKFVEDLSLFKVKHNELIEELTINKSKHNKLEEALSISSSKYNNVEKELSLHIRKQSELLEEVSLNKNKYNQVSDNMNQSKNQIKILENELISSKNEYKGLIEELSFCRKDSSKMMDILVLQEKVLEDAKIRENEYNSYKSKLEEFINTIERNAIMQINIYENEANFLKKQNYIISKKYQEKYYKSKEYRSKLLKKTEELDLLSMTIVELLKCNTPLNSPCKNSQ
jgi:hypothetical protein